MSDGRNVWLWVVTFRAIILLLHDLVRTVMLLWWIPGLPLGSPPWWFHHFGTETRGCPSTRRPPPGSRSSARLPELRHAFLRGQSSLCAVLEQHYVPAEGIADRLLIGCSVGRRLNKNCSSTLVQSLRCFHCLHPHYDYHRFVSTTSTS